MALFAKFERVQPDDPNRCQAVHANEQCPFKATGTYNLDSKSWIGSKYCRRHGGANPKGEILEEKRMYTLAKWQADIANKQIDHPKIKSLGEEIAIVRMTLQSKLNLIKDDKDLVMQAMGIVALTNSVRDMLKTWQHIEERSGQVLDRTKMNVFVTELIGILNNYIDDPEILQLIGEDISGSLDLLFKPAER